MSTSLTNKIIQFVQPRLNRRSVAFVLCVLLSGLFWLLTSLSKEYVDEVDIPVAYRNLPDNLLIANEPTAMVRAKVKGLGFDLLWHWLRFEKMEITVNANPAELPSVRRKGKEYHYLFIRNGEGRVASMEDDKLEILSIAPDTLFVRFIPKFTKMVPVRLNADISFSKQYGMVTEPVLIPDSILLIGPKKDIDTVQFVLTEPQTWNDLNESVTAEVTLSRFNGLPYVRYDQNAVQVELNVVEFTEGSVMVTLEIDAKRPESVKVFPNQVEIKYLVPLSSYDDVRPEQFRATVVVDGNSIDETSLPVVISEQPSVVSQVRIIPSQVEFILQQ